MGSVRMTIAGIRRCDTMGSGQPNGRSDASRYNLGVSRYYGPHDADDLLPELVAVVGRLRDQRAELLALRDEVRARERSLAGGSTAGDRGSGDDAELRRLNLKMRGIVDQMQADVAWLDDRDIVLRDIATGLIDVPALAAGRPVWLCWRLGEDRVEYWHDTDAGFSGRKPLADLPDGAARA